MKYTLHSLLLVFTLGLTLGACETQEDAPFAESCDEVGTYFHFCRNLSKDENDNYSQRGVARGKKVHKADDDCGQLWTEAYACVANLACEDFERWRTMNFDPMLDFPGAEEGLAFLTQCPDLPLYSDG